MKKHGRLILALTAVAVLACMGILFYLKQVGKLDVSYELMAVLAAMAGLAAYSCFRYKNQ